MTPRTRGFTLIEMVAAVAVTVMVFGAIMEVFIIMEYMRRVTLARAEMDRDSALAMDWLKRDIYGAGAGIARSTSRVGGSGYPRLTPPIMAANVAARAGATSDPPTSTSFMIVGDLPRPDTAFDQFSMISDNSPSTSNITLLNELAGRLTSTGTNRVGALDPTAYCDATHSDGCPWGFRKYVTSTEYPNGATIQVVFPDGTWENNTVTSKQSSSSPVYLGLGAGVSGSLTNPAAFSVMTQVDRVAYKIDTTNGRLLRRHCWGVVTPDTGTFGLDNTSVTGCTSVGGGSDPDTGWQTVARNVASTSTFTYYDNTGALAATPDKIGVVLVTLNFAKTVSLGKSFKTLAATYQARMMMRSINL